MAGISSSVGRGGVNIPTDVRQIQTLLAKTVAGVTLPINGTVDARTISAIEDFQRRVVKMVNPDGRIDPGGRTYKALAAALETGPAAASTALPSPKGSSSLTEGDFARAAAKLGCEVAAVKAVTAVESGSSGFFASGRPKILFEAHVFSKQTGHRYDATNPDISSPKWNRSLYKYGEKEYERLVAAMALDRTAALKSASWGRFQIMGFNCQQAGYPNVEIFVQAMYQSEGNHLDAFVSFLQKSPMAAALREKRWADFARSYNGAGYATNHYDVKIEQAYKKYAGAAS